MKADARQVALDVLWRVRAQSAFAGSALRAALDDNPMSPADRGLATELVYGVLRRQAFLDRAIRKASGKRMKDIDRRVKDILRMAAYQVMYLDRVPDHAAVSTAVELAKKNHAGRGAGFVNAALRRLTELDPDKRDIDPPHEDDDPTGHVAHVGGVAKAMAEHWIKDMGFDEAKAFAIASLDPAPLVLRANLLRTTRDELMAEVEGTPGVDVQAVVLPSGTRLPALLPAVKEGRATPQDEASMRVVALMDPQPGESILDVCAAPGGKTTCAGERMGNKGRIVAHDRHPVRLDRVRVSAERLGLTIVEIAEALPDVEEKFDRVLVDAPCSGMGTLRRHPEIRWRFELDDLSELNLLQDKVLQLGAERVKPGGVLVYSVCTVTRSEGEDRLEALKKDFEVEEIIRTGPHQEGAPDGFFAARLRRRG